MIENLLRSVLHIDMQFTVAYRHKALFVVPLSTGDTRATQRQSPVLFRPKDPIGFSPFLCVVQFSCQGQEKETRCICSDGVHKRQDLSGKALPFPSHFAPSRDLGSRLASRDIQRDDIRALALPHHGASCSRVVVIGDGAGRVAR